MEWVGLGNEGTNFFFKTLNSKELFIYEYFAQLVSNLDYRIRGHGFISKALLFVFFNRFTVLFFLDVYITI